MKGHNIASVPMNSAVQDLPWYLCDKGVRRAGIGVLAIMAVAGSLYAGMFAFEAMPWRDAGWASVLFEVAKGVVPVALLVLLAMHRPLWAAGFAVLLGLAAAVLVPVPSAAAMLLGLSLVAGGLLFVSGHK